MKRVEPFLKIEPILDYKARPLPFWMRCRKWFTEVTDEIDRPGWRLLATACCLLLAGIPLWIIGGLLLNRVGAVLIIVGLGAAGKFYRGYIQQSRW